MEGSHMKFRLIRPATIAPVVLAALIAAAPSASPAGVPVHPLILRAVGPLPRQIRANAPPAAKPWHAVRPGPHVFYGTIAALRGNLITLRLRNGRSVPVDVSVAIANGNYSVPLFIGKMVSVDGTLAGGGFMATHVFRMSNLANLPPDK
jgi:hypothetical protein